MTEEEINKAVFADKHLGREPALYETCIDTCMGMLRRGWEFEAYDGPARESATCLLVTFKRTQGTSKRRMTLFFGLEWPKGVGVKYVVARVQELSVVSAKTMTYIPLRGEYAVHVHQDDPCLTATILNTLSDEELEEQYSPTSRLEAATKSMRETGAAVLRDLQD